MHSRSSVLLLLAAAVLGACAPEASRPPTPLATSSTDSSWTLSLKQTGGFAGVQLSAEVTSAGELTARNERSNQQITKSLPPQAMDELRSLIASTNLVAAQPKPSACADCFIYVLEYDSAGGVQKIQVDDVTLPNSGAQPLILYVRSLRDEALASQP